MVQYFAYMGSSHRGKGAARHIIDVVWQYRSPIPVGRRGYSKSINYFYLPFRRLKEGLEGGQHPVHFIRYANLILGFRCKFP
jgi:hypothetical protein